MGYFESIAGIFGHEFMQRAVWACIMIGFTNGFLGVYVVMRQMALVADALSHSLLPGMALAGILFGLNPAGLLIGGLLAALFVALGGQIVSSVSRIKQETAVASLFIMAFAMGVILLQVGNFKVSLIHFLFGDLLGISMSDLWLAYAVGTTCLISLPALSRPLLLAVFEPSVARTQGIPVPLMYGGLLTLTVLAMISALQAVGILLALGLLILPAGTVYLLTDRFPAMPWYAGSLGAACGVVGLVVSYFTDLPSGPAIILVLGIAFFTALICSPRYGWLASRLRKRHFHDESLARWEEQEKS